MARTRQAILDAMTDAIDMSDAVQMQRLAAELERQPIEAKMQRLAELRAERAELTAEHTTARADEMAAAKVVKDIMAAIVEQKRLLGLAQRETGLASTRFIAVRERERAIDLELGRLTLELRGAADAMTAPVVHSTWQKRPADA